MSLAYRISVSESVTRTVVVEDSVCSKLELLEVLPREELGRMLKAELERRGFEQAEGAPQVLVRSQDGVEIAVDLDQGVVSIRLSDEQEVEVTRERSERTEQAPGRQQQAEAAIRQRLQADIEKAIEQKRQGLRAEATARLEKLLAELKKEVDDAVNRVTADALKIRASQLGEIEEVVEEPDGSVTIKVRT